VSSARRRTWPLPCAGGQAVRHHLYLKIAPGGCPQRYSGA
jgi:hypothetical protein